MSWCINHTNTIFLPFHININMEKSKFKIKNNTLQDAIDASIEMYPLEFMCFLSSKAQNNVIDELIIFPTYNGPDAASVDLNSIPIGMGIIGSLHSHPSNYIIPSKADLEFFRRYDINIIIGSNNRRNYKVFNKNGEKILLEVI